MRWGLIPFWAKNRSIGSRMINARAEMVAEKPSFRDSFRRRRCLVLADGFYEWQRTGSGKRPMHVALRSGEPLAFAGIWSIWKDTEGNSDTDVRHHHDFGKRTAQAHPPSHARYPAQEHGGVLAR